MYSQDEINSAIAAGALTQEAADALRAHVVQVRHRPVTDEEHFRLINSFNDIFVAIGIVIMLLAAGAIGQAIGGGIFPRPEAIDWAVASDAEIASYRQGTWLRESMSVAFAAILVAATSWPLAEFFTRNRRMALPSIILLVAFVGAVFAGFVGLSLAMIGNGENMDRVGAVMIALSGLFAAGAAWLHWRRFMVPITVAAGAAACAVTVIALILAALGPKVIDDGESLILGLVFIAGLAIFAFAMRWDMSDRERSTRRSDVAFWLHLLAAPMIAHPIFHALGVTDGGTIGIGGALGVIAIYVLFGIVALAIDRRALLVSALAYVLAALTFLFDEFGAVELNFALTALVIGSALLTLSAFWSPIRQKVVMALPGDVQGRLPATALATA
ncbi:hypothetical protein [Parerythrobacter aestuarii]|uniref:hypothetical protein n=1 Tax=Parerythrobacter aestuarii TaxID=3020909 RepID=UPI0024DE406B|nr:hypothetical protein [Parerythrobacter aestuarii]